MKNIKFDLHDINLIPTESSKISSRQECKVLSIFSSHIVTPRLSKMESLSTQTRFDTLPLMASPMDTVVDLRNIKDYTKNSIIPCIPRGQNTKKADIISQSFQAYGLKDIEYQLDEYFKRSNTTNTKLTFTSFLAFNSTAFYTKKNVLIDIANGHMKKLEKLVKTIKNVFPDLNLMIGNVANPKTYKRLSDAGADYVRCSVGSGAGCTTAANVAVNYPLGSLISECYALKKEYKLNAKIVADGGMKNFDDIIKVLALGANYAMIGSIFNKAIESAGFNYLWKIKINNYMAYKLWKWGFPIVKKYRGMSTKSVQRSWGKSKLVTAEGITKYQKVNYNLDQWTENFKDYLKSTMSYCNAKTLEDFIGKAEYVFITNAARKRFEK